MNRFLSVISEKRAAAYGDWKEEGSLFVLERYLGNIRISQAFYPLLDFFEISLRNRINNFFVEDYGEDWLLKNDFFDRETQNAVEEARKRLEKKGKKL